MGPEFTKAVHRSGQMLPQFPRTFSVEQQQQQKHNSKTNMQKKRSIPLQMPLHISGQRECFRAIRKCSARLGWETFDAHK